MGFLGAKARYAEVNRPLRYCISYCNGKNPPSFVLYAKSVETIPLYCTAYRAESALNLLHIAHFTRSFPLLSSYRTEARGF